MNILIYYIIKQLASNSTSFFIKLLSKIWFYLITTFGMLKFLINNDNK